MLVGQRNVFPLPRVLAGRSVRQLSHGPVAVRLERHRGYEADRLNPRKGTFLFGARGTPEQLRGLPLRIALVQLPFMIAFSVLAGTKILLCFPAMWPRPRCQLATVWLQGAPTARVLNQAGIVSVSASAG